MGSATPISVICLGIVTLVSMILIFTAKVPDEQAAGFHLIAIEMILSTAILTMLVPLMDGLLGCFTALHAYNSKYRHDLDETLMLLIAGKYVEMKRDDGDKTLCDTQLEVMTSMKEILKMELEKAQSNKYIHDKNTECNASSSNSEISPANEVDVKRFETVSGASSVSAAVTVE